MQTRALVSSYCDIVWHMSPGGVDFGCFCSSFDGYCSLVLVWGRVFFNMVV
jgi:hypothetical protein